MLKCEAIEDDLEENLSWISRDAMAVYNACSNQVIVAGLGTVLGINHQAIHAYMKMQFGFTPLEYRTVFNRVISIDRIAGIMRERYKEANTSGNGNGPTNNPKSTELPT